MSAPPGPNNPSPSGLRLGRYELLTRLGAGGMGEVWVARQRSLGGFERLVAVKRILPRFASDPSFVSRFANEARVAASLTHPHIVQIYDLEQDGGEVFIAMELVRGETLQSVIRRAWELTGQPIPNALAAGIMARVCRALHHAHTHHDPVARVSGLVHRDVAPANVLIGYRGEVKVVDFGIARALSGVKAASGPLHGEGGASTSGGSGGRVAYMSPEQCRGEDLDGRSDVFSAGIVLWEMLTGMRLFGGMTAEETRAAVTDTTPVRDASMTRPGLDGGLSSIAQRALQRDRSARFQSAAAMADTLEAHLLAQGIVFSEGPLVHLMERLFRDQQERWSSLVAAAGSLGGAAPPEVRGAERPAESPAPDRVAEPPALASPVRPPEPSNVSSHDEGLLDLGEFDLFESTIQDDLPRFDLGSALASDHTDPDEVAPVLALSPTLPREVAPEPLSPSPVTERAGLAGVVADGFEPSPFDRDGDDEDDEDDEHEERALPLGRSFVEALDTTEPTPVAASADQSLAVELLELGRGKIVQTTEVIIRKGTHAAKKGRFVGASIDALIGRGEVTLTLPERAQAEGGAPAPRELKLVAGQTQTVVIDEAVYRLRAFVPPRLPRGIREAAWAVYAVAIVVALGMHGLSAPVFAFLEDAGIAASVVPMEEKFAEGRMAAKKDRTQPKPPQKVVKPPPTKEVRREEPKRPTDIPKPVVAVAQSVEATPQLPRSVREKVAAARRSTTTGSTAPKSSVDELKSRLTTPNAGAASKLADVRTNIDAKDAGRASDVHRVTGVADHLPGVTAPSFAKDGGGPTAGPLAGEAARTVASKLADSAPQKTGAVRGKVTGMKSATKVSGQLDPGQVYAVIDRSIGKIQACYESRLRIDGALSGRITFRWTVGITGGVSGVQQTASTVSDPEVATCVKRVLEGLRFPKPDGGTVEISYPFIFRSS